MDKITYYCQKCRAGNESGEVNCRKCGTRLMLVVFPPSVRHDSGSMPSYFEDHLLERVSLLELRLAQVMEQMAAAYEFIQREVKSFHKDHVLLQSFFETLEKVNPDLSELLSRECIELYGKNSDQIAGIALNREAEEIFAEYDGTQPELFTQLVREGFRLLSGHEEKHAFQTLERAILLSPKNVSLLAFVAKKQFDAEKFGDAKGNLEKAFDVSPHDPRVMIMLGACFADEGAADEARKLLALMANNSRTSLCVNLIWGILASHSESWMEALAAFKECLSSGSLPEINYLAGCVYYQLGRRRSALSHLRKAVAADPKFADAWFMQSLVFETLGDEEKAAECRRAALGSREAGAQCTEFIKGKKVREPEIALPFLHFKDRKKRLLTGGSVRLSKLFRKEVLRAIE